jgi:hypothetical protein
MKSVLCRGPLKPMIPSPRAPVIFQEYFRCLVTTAAAWPCRAMPCLLLTPAPPPAMLLPFSPLLTPHIFYTFLFCCSLRGRCCRLLRKPLPQPLLVDRPPYIEPPCDPPSSTTALPAGRKPTIPPLSQSLAAAARYLCYPFALPGPLLATLL